MTNVVQYQPQVPAVQENRNQIVIYKPSTAASMRQAFSACIFGQSGVGKTMLLGTLPAVMGRGLVVDVPLLEGGTLVLEDKQEWIDVTDVRDWNQDLDKVFWHIRDAQHPFKWIAIDSITGLQVLARNKVVSERTFADDPHKITLPEFGAIGTLVGDVVLRFKSLGIPIFWIAQERRFGNPEKGEHVMIGPNILPGALQYLMPPMMLVGRLTKETSPDDGQPERWLRIQQHPDYWTKVRARPGKEVGNVVRKPDLAVLLRYLYGDGPAPEWAQENTSGIIFL